MKPFKERRSEQRRGLHRRAKLLHGDGEKPIDCVIRNAGKKGCLIVSEDLVQLQGRDVGLLVGGVEKLIKGTVIWCKGSSVGIQFDDVTEGNLLNSRRIYPEQVRSEPLASASDSAKVEIEI